MKITKPYTNLIVEGINHTLREGEEEDPACTTQFAGYCLEPCSARGAFFVRNPVTVYLLEGRPGAVSAAAKARCVLARWR